MGELDKEKKHIELPTSKSTKNDFQLQKGNNGSCQGGKMYIYTQRVEGNGDVNHTSGNQSANAGKCIKSSTKKGLQKKREPVCVFSS